MKVLAFFAFVLLPAAVLTACTDHVSDGHGDGWFALGPARVEGHTTPYGFDLALYVTRSEPVATEPPWTGHYHALMTLPGLEMGSTRNSERRHDTWRLWRGGYFAMSWAFVMFLAFGTGVAIVSLRYLRRRPVLLKPVPAPQQPDDAPQDDWRHQPGGRGTMVEDLLDPALDYDEFLSRLVLAQAVAIGASEAAAFRVGGGDEMELHLVSHYRSEDDGAEARARAVEAFREILFGVAFHPKGGIIDVAVEWGTPDAQRCFAIPLYAGGELRAMVGLVRRVATREEARTLHARAEMIGAGYHEAFWMRQGE